MSKRQCACLAIVVLLAIVLSGCGVSRRIQAAQSCAPEINDLTASPDPTYYGQTCGADSP